MDKPSSYLTQELDLNLPTSRELIVQIGSQLDIKFPKDYIDFMAKTNGGGTAYAFDARFENISIIEVPFIGMDLKEISKCSDTFVGFLNICMNITK